MSSTVMRSKEYENIVGDVNAAPVKRDVLDEIFGQVGSLGRGQTPDPWDFEHKKSTLVGVERDPVDTETWRAFVIRDGETVYSANNYETREMAALVRDAMVLRYDENATDLNFPMQRSISFRMARERDFSVPVHLTASRYSYVKRDRKNGQWMIRVRGRDGKDIVKRGFETEEEAAFARKTLCEYMGIPVKCRRKIR